jgi:hypothetical protein
MTEVKKEKEMPKGYMVYGKVLGSSLYEQQNKETKKMESKAKYKVLVGDSTEYQALELIELYGQNNTKLKIDDFVLVECSKSTFNGEIKMRYTGIRQV